MVVAGLGNVLLQDDGIGVHAARLLAADPPPGALVVDIGTAVFDGLRFLESATHVLAIDAMQAGGAPGDLYLVSGTQVPEPERSASLHAMGLKSALRLLPDGGRGLEWLVLGVEPQAIGYGMELSPAVQAVLPRVVDTARALVARWTAGATATDLTMMEMETAILQ